ncbi:small ribosomal subunit protein uS14m [Hetaerina americana]|uniref:small ribosomal subunit protein uS14m n=1 Tax=Hetaerina americana TaxID=62018 RepID=UPI003A7F3CEA
MALKLKNLAIPVIHSHSIFGFGLQQIRNKWADWRMIKDAKRRKIVAQYAEERLRIQAIRKCDVLPPEIKEIADKEIAAQPRDASQSRLVRRCAITSRPRGTVYKWRLSRIVFRHLADYNKLSGVQRAIW